METGRWKRENDRTFALNSEQETSVSAEGMHVLSFPAYAELCLVTEPYLTLCDPMECSPPGSSLHGILQARILEWVALHSSRGSSQPRDGTQVSPHCRHFAP